MTTVLSCLLILCILPIVCSWIGGYHRQKQLGNVDNKEPRIQAQQLTGAGGRAVAAQGNSWEALALYSAAVLAVFISGMDLNEIATLSIALVVMRIVYIPAYLANQDIVRSLLFLGSFGICMYFFYLALSAA